MAVVLGQNVHSSMRFYACLTTRWVVAKDKPKYDEIFNSLEQDKEKLLVRSSLITSAKKKYSFEGRAAKEEMMKSHLPNKVPC